jgi:hypothetical protein
LQWIETQIEGLAKRTLSIKNYEGLDDYYTLVTDLQTKLDKQVAINSNYEPKMQQTTARIAELEAEVAILRASLVHFDDYKYENESYKTMFKQISNIVKDPRRVAEIEKAVNDQIAPLLNEFEVKLETLTRTTSTEKRGENDPKVRLRGQVTGLLRDFERIMKGTEELTMANVEKILAGFLKEVDLMIMFEKYQDGQLLKHKYEDLLINATANARMFRSKLDSLLKENPQLRSQVDMTVFDKMAKSDIKVSTFNNIITIDNSCLAGRTVYYQTQNK